MGSYFLDSSAIVKRYVSEKGQSLILTLCNPAEGHELYISQTTLVEVVAALCRRAREQSITITERDRLINVFRRPSQKMYGIRRITADLYTSAANLCRSHKLRAYDAIQLASALKLRDKALGEQALVPIFVCADNELLSIAITEGLSVENPNDYP